MRNVAILVDGGFYLKLCKKQSDANKVIVENDDVYYAQQKSVDMKIGLDTTLPRNT